jgi:Arylsulfotransferase (ASST)
VGRARPLLRTLPASVSRSAIAIRPRARSLGARHALAAAGALGLVAAAVVVPTVADSPYALQRFRSRPDLRPPVVEVARGRVAGGGYIFVAPKNGPGPAGPMILDRSGHLVWFEHLPKGIQAFDFRPQRYHGRPVLTWWEGHSAKGNGAGVDVIADTSYRVIARVPMPAGSRADLHEFTLTGRGTALVPVYRQVWRDLRGVGGPARGKVVDGVIEEVDVATGRVVFEWSSLDHVPLAESYKKYSDRSQTEASKSPQGYDYFHLNSIREERGGRLLISARHTNAVYEIDKRTGAVAWRLGGKRSSFAMGPGTRFAAQHDARRGPHGTISVFDNQAPPDTGRQSRVVSIKLDPRTRSARLAREYVHPKPVHSDSQGSAQPLRNGDVFVGWGGKSPRFSEFDRTGRLVFDARFGPDAANSYRAFLLPWRGRPAGRPALAAERGSGGAVVYASWNGATGVAAWEVLGGERPGALRRITRAARTDFETAIDLPRAPRYVAVRALARSGKRLRRSRAVEVR